jgi:hypothetical protein
MEVTVEQCQSGGDKPVLSVFTHVQGNSPLVHDRSRSPFVRDSSHHRHNISSQL